jgi:hypothetical protein
MKISAAMEEITNTISGISYNIFLLPLYFIRQAKI